MTIKELARDVICDEKARKRLSNFELGLESGVSRATIERMLCPDGVNNVRLDSIYKLLQYLGYDFSIQKMDDSCTFENVKDASEAYSTEGDDDASGASAIVSAEKDEHIELVRFILYFPLMLKNMTRLSDFFFRMCSCGTTTHFYFKRQLSVLYASIADTPAKRYADLLIESVAIRFNRKKKVKTRKSHDYRVMARVINPSSKKLVQGREDYYRIVYNAPYVIQMLRDCFNEYVFAKKDIYSAYEIYMNNRSNRKPAPKCNRLQLRSDQPGENIDNRSKREEVSNEPR